MHDDRTQEESALDDPTPGVGEVGGRLEPGEDGQALARVLRQARALIDSHELSPLCHADLEPGMPEAERDCARSVLRGAVLAGRLKRFVLRVPTTAGPRIVKIAEANTLGGKLLGVVGISRSRREDRLHRRAETLSIAAARPLGFLELRRGPLLLRSCQIQCEVPPEHLPLGAFFAAELAARGPIAAETLGRALAETHRAPFFHSDLKPFHAFVTDQRHNGDGPASYRLRWIDLDRVAFWMSRRKRVINLYQALRYVVPDEPDAQRRFVTAYCQTSGWYAASPDRALALVCRFLAYKRRTHPHP
jgi:hypothetical protein